MVSQLYFARYRFQMASHWAWHSHTLRCHAFYITVCLLCAASSSRAAYSSIFSLWTRLWAAFCALSVFRSHSVLWLLKFCWFPVFSSCSMLRLHTDPYGVSVLDRSGSGQVLFPECLCFALRSPRIPLSGFGWRMGYNCWSYPCLEALCEERKPILQGNQETARIIPTFTPSLRINALSTQWDWLNG